MRRVLLVCVGLALVSMAAAVVGTVVTPTRTDLPISFTAVLRAAFVALAAAAIAVSHTSRVGESARLVSCSVVGAAVFGLIAMTFDETDLLDPTWRSRGAIAWY